MVAPNWNVCPVVDTAQPAHYQIVFHSTSCARQMSIQCMLCPRDINIGLHSYISSPWVDRHNDGPLSQNPILLDLINVSKMRIAFIKLKFHCFCTYIMFGNSWNHRASWRLGSTFLGGIQHLVLHINTADRGLPFKKHKTVQMLGFVLLALVKQSSTPSATISYCLACESRDTFWIQRWHWVR